MSNLQTLKLDLVIVFSWQIHHIPENPNPKSGIIPGSYSFESVLSAVADFKAPVFEPGGSMQQGMYTPKGMYTRKFFPVYTERKFLFVYLLI